MYHKGGWATIPCSINTGRGIMKVTEYMPDPVLLAAEGRLGYNVKP